MLNVHFSMFFFLFNEKLVDIIVKYRMEMINNI